MIKLRTLLWVIALAGASLLAGTGGASAAGCEGISNPFAYNECLAKQSPQSRRSVSPRRGGNPEASVRSRSRYSPGPRDDVGGVRISRGRNRSSAVIDPWASIKRTFNPPRKRRR